MKRILMCIGAMTLGCALLVACEKDNTISGPNGGGGGDGPAGTPDALVIARSFPGILANGMDQIEVKATVVDSQGRGIQNVGVFFATNHGTIEPYATTNASGVATTRLTSEGNAADVTATVTATASTQTAAPGTVSASSSGGAALPPDAVVIVSRASLTEEAIEAALEQHELTKAAAGKTGLAPAADQVIDQVSIVMKGVTVTISATPSVIPADGISTSNVTANLTETTSHVPLQGEDVTFGATAGTITGHVSTGAGGSAVATLTGLTSGSSSTVTAFYGPTLRAATNVSFSALTMTLASERPSLFADGTSTTRVTARILSAERNPVAGASVTFTTDRGNITSPAVTNASGDAVATLMSGSTPGTANIQAVFGATTSTISVNFAALPVSTTLVLAASPASIPADGASEAELVAHVLDANGNPMPDGTSVTFAIISGGGNILGPVQAMTGGEARATYVAGTVPGAVSLRASAGVASMTFPLTLQALSPVGLTFASESSSILADGLASTLLSATVIDNFGNPVAAGTKVDFKTSRGEIIDVVPTNAAGLATARLRATARETGLARVTASVGGLQNTVDVNFTSGDASVIEVINLDHSSIGVDGSADYQTSTVVYEVMDRSGIPVDAAHSAMVTFLINPTNGLTDATIFPATASTNELGLVSGTVRAGTIAGAIETRAAIGTIMSRPIRLAIHGDLPDAAHFSIAFNKLNVPGRVPIFGIHDEVLALVGDRYGNPVPDSTAVWFTTNYGLIQGSGFTNDHGEGFADHITGNPVPPTGFVTITAQTVAKDGNRITTTGQVLWSGRTIVEITSPAVLDVPSGGSVVINYRVHDDLNHPLAAGTKITVTATAGALTGATSVDLGDTQDTGPGTTDFSVVLSDTDTSTLARPVIVTVKVASPNGDGEDTLAGTIH